MSITQSQVQQAYIVELLEQLNTDYQNSILDQRQIARSYSSSEEFTALEEMELLTVSIRGYACQIKATGNVNNINQAIAHLQELGVFNNYLIVQLYSEARSQYPNVQKYILMLDYLRLLTLEYLQMHKNLQPISA
jgi:hypothetical protein